MAVDKKPPTATSSNSKKNPRMGSFLERFVASLIDGVVLGFVGFFLCLTIFLIFIPFGIFSTAWGDKFTLGIQLQFVFLGLIFTALYYGYFYVYKGQTPGKMTMKLKVVKASTLTYLSWKDALIRELPGKWISSLLFNLGYLWYFMSEKRQTWHDSIAGTYVVKTNDSGRILLDGRSFYKKEPLKTFASCGCFIVITILFLAGIFFASAKFADLLKEENDSSYPADEYDQRQRDIYEDGVGKGELCGGFAGVPCKDGFVCKVKNKYPDAMGVCVESESPFRVL